MLIADLHIHSKYSRATSRECDAPHLELSARRKGISLVGTGDFTHPAWRAELADALTPAEDGLYTLRVDHRLDGPADAPRFVVSGEISCIYKKDGKVRKVHNLILLPSLDAAERLSRRLEAIGNIRSDGRPILGLDSRDLLEITLEACPDAIFVPAHIWTPHFSMFGAFSGFDTMEQCFGDLTPYIHAVETGLSSDPPMNWRLSALDGYTLLSNSDAHSPAKLGREANLLDIPYSYAALSRAVAQVEDAGYRGTIEFFPEEGKYHLDGHRACKQCLTPAQTAQAGGRCPVCGKKITIGVLNRVEQLADRPEGYQPAHAARFESLAPLPEVIAASTGRKPGCVGVMREYEAMLRELGTEFSILRDVPLADIGRVAGPCVQEGMRRLRAGEVRRTPGYDGEYGVISLLSAQEIEEMAGQLCLFPGLAPEFHKKPSARTRSTQQRRQSSEMPLEPPKAEGLDALNDEQRAAATADDRVIAVSAGPGTGKTKTLIARVAYLVEQHGVKPSEITAVTFTNKAAGELKARLEQHFGDKRTVRALHIGTFHALCVEELSRRGPVCLAGPGETEELAANIITEFGLKLSPVQLLREVSRAKNGLAPDETGAQSGALDAYNARLAASGALDFDDLLLRELDACKAGRPSRRFAHVLVDEFQDSNPVQYQLVEAWNRDGDSLFVIGDPDQSIYGFRGADAGCFDRLRTDWPGVRDIRLSRNYRSAPPILTCALSVIAGDGGAPRMLEPQRPDGPPVSVLTADSDLSEAIYVAKEINRLAGGIDMLDAQAARAQAEDTCGFSDIAVIYRTHRQAALLEKCLRQESIPYVVAGRDDCMNDPEVRAALAFFRFLTQPRDTAALRTCVRLRWGCPADLADALCAAWDGADGAVPDTDALRAAFASLADAPCVQFLCAAAGLLVPQLKKGRPDKLLEAWAEQQHLTQSEPLSRLINMAVLHSTMPAFLQSALLGSEGDLLRSAGRSYAAGAVTLMTLHASKGLEFPVVLLCGVKRGTVPLEPAHGEANLPEERRLLYVGMTRARDRLVLLTGPEPSPFLDALPAGSVETGSASPRKRRAAAQQPSLFDL